MPSTHQHKYWKNTWQILQRLVERTESYVKNFTTFIKIISNVTLNKDDIIARFDVNTLYPNVLIDEAINLIATNQDLADDFLSVAKHCGKTHSSSSTTSFTRR